MSFIGDRGIEIASALLGRDGDRATRRSQDYLCKQLLQWDTSRQGHNAALDAVKSIRLYHHWAALQTDPASWRQAQVPAPPILKAYLVQGLYV